MSEHEATRRNVLYGAAAAGLAVPILAACGSDESGDATGSTDPSTSSGSTPDGSTPTSEAPGGIPTSDIPVGGGKIFEDERVVVTQPTAGEFKAFSAACTHQGCIVTSVKDKTINCTCHGSKFSIEDGSVDQGPATKALPEKTVTVNGDSLTVS